MTAPKKTAENIDPTGSTVPEDPSRPPAADGFKGDNPVDNGVFLAGQQGNVVEVSGDGRFYEQHLAGDRTRSDENAS